MKTPRISVAFLVFFSLSFAGFGCGDTNTSPDTGASSLPTFLATDTDGDGVTDDVDNCTEIPNPEQVNTDGDRFGNACDGDFDQTGGLVGYADLVQMRDALGKRVDSNDCLNDQFAVGGSCEEFDLDGELPVIGYSDLARFRQLIGKEPGPGIPLGELGDACETDEDCTTEVCLAHYPGGYCSLPCDFQVCSSCLGTVETGYVTMCLARCRQADDCREGYACARSYGEYGNYTGTCQAHCDSDLECRPGQVCNDDRQCVDVDRGDCETAYDCEEFAGWFYTHAYDVEVGYGEACVAGECSALCTEDSECRDGEVCGDHHACTLPPGSREIGEACRGEQDCIGWSSDDEDFTGCDRGPSYPGGYCSTNCSEYSFPGDRCGSGDGICAHYWCLDQCEVPDDCRAPYACVRHPNWDDPYYPVQAHVCVTDCTSDDQCRAGETCGLDGACLSE